MNKVGRPKVVIEYPTNFPLLMFDIIDRSTNETIRTVAKNGRLAKQNLKIKSAFVKPTSPSAVFNELGHQGTNDFLRQFGDRWMTKDGKIFYGERTID